MKTVGLITEYNPFHNGHAWHIREAKRLSGADFCVVVMSGNFVQRGAPAILDKYARTQMALACGADLVLELPVAYALGSAEYFASGAVSLLDGLGVVDALCFGSECGELFPLSLAAAVLGEEPEEYVQLLRQKLKSGKSFPLARAEAFGEYVEGSDEKGLAAHRIETGEGFLSESASLLEQPNNILGIEYLKALNRLGSAMLPLTIPRAGAAYHSEGMEGPLCSATALRRLLCQGANGEAALGSVKSGVPAEAWKLLEAAFGRSCPMESRDFSNLLHFRLLSVSSPEELACFQDISGDLSDRIFGLVPEYRGIDEFVGLVKTRQFTESRIRRCLLHILLDIKKEDVAKQKALGWNGYARVLGFRKKSSSLLHAVKEKSCLPLITKLSAAGNLLPTDQMEFLKKDIYASQVYQSAVLAKFGGEAYSEYRCSPVIFSS